MVIATTLHSGPSGGSGTGELSVSSEPAGQATATGSASAVAACSAGPPGQAVPAAFLGHWTGTLTDNTGVEGPQPADLRLASGAVNSVAGTVSYPNVGCGYNLRLLSSAANQAELYEEVQSGPCISEYVMLTRSGTGITESVYASQPNGQQPDFNGQLTKSAGG